MLRQMSLAWSNINNNGRTIGLLSLDKWHGVNLWGGVTKTNFPHFIDNSEWVKDITNMFKFCSRVFLKERINF